MHPAFGKPGSDSDSRNEDWPLRVSASFYAWEPKVGFRIGMQSLDGIAGEVDLSDLARQGLCRAWNNRASFKAFELGAFAPIKWGSTG